MRRVLVASTRCWLLPSVFVFGIMRLVNFAQGDYITLGAYALILPSGDAVATMLVGSWPWPVMVLTVIVVCVIAALLTERLVFRPLRRADSETLLIASFAVSFLIQNVVLVVYGGRPKSAGILDGLTESVTLFGNLRVAGVELVTLATVASAVAGLVLFLRYTSLGVQMRAVAEDFRMAQLLGVRGNRVIAIAFGHQRADRRDLFGPDRRTDRCARLSDGRTGDRLCVFCHRRRRHGQSCRSSARRFRHRIAQRVSASLPAGRHAAVP